MSRRRLEKGYWNGRQVKITPKEHSLLFAKEHGTYYHRHEMIISMDYPYPSEVKTEYRLPRKTKKALWKHFNGHPETDPRDGVRAYNGWSWGIYWSTPGLFHNGGKAN